MFDIIQSPSLFIAFLIACLILAITPGPGVFYIVTRSISQGRASGLASVAGVALGNWGNAVGASIGLAAIFAASSLAFTVVKYTGALYLVYLGIKAIRAPSPINQVGEIKLGRVALGKIFKDGFVVALLNPKTTLFFAAFLPQFLHTNQNSLMQSLGLGTIFVLIALTTDTSYALLAGAVRPLLQRRQNAGVVGKYASGGAFIGLGLFTAFSGQRTQ